MSFSRPKKGVLGRFLRDHLFRGGDNKEAVSTLSFLSVWRKKNFSQKGFPKRRGFLRKCLLSSV